MALLHHYDDRPVTAWGGMQEMKLLMDKTGMRSKLEELPLPISNGNNSISGLDIIESFLVSIWIRCFRFGHTAVVRMDEVLRRYAWADNPEVNLYNASLLPPQPFRTD